MWQTSSRSGLDWIMGLAPCHSLISMSSSGVEQVGLATRILVFELIPPHKAKVYTTLVACDSAGGEQHTTEVEDVTSEHAGPSCLQFLLLPFFKVY